MVNSAVRSQGAGASPASAGARADAASVLLIKQWLRVGAFGPLSFLWEAVAGATLQWALCSPPDVAQAGREKGQG